MRKALADKDGACIAALLDDTRESAKGTWLEPVVAAYRSKADFNALVRRRATHAHARTRARRS